MDSRNIDLKIKLAASRRINAAAAGKQPMTPSYQLISGFAHVRTVEAGHVDSLMIHKWYVFKKA